MSGINYSRIYVLYRKETRVRKREKGEEGNEEKKDKEEKN